MNRFVVALCLVAMSQYSWADWSDGCPETMTNSHECYLYKESQLAKRYGNLFYRKGKAQNLHVRLGNSQIKVLKDVPEIEGVERVAYSHVLVGYYPDVNYWLVAIQYIEGSSYFLLNGKNGREFKVDGETFLSPDKTRFVVANFDIEAGWSPNILSIWRVEEDRLIQEFSVEPEEWGATTVIWEGDSTVRFSKTSWSKDGDQYVTEAKRLIGAPVTKGKGKTWAIR
jgi:hypothetical protein